MHWMLFTNMNEDMDKDWNHGLQMLKQLCEQ